MSEESYVLIRGMGDGQSIRLDFKRTMQKGRIMDFSINLCLIEEERNTEIYRIDTEHGYIHEHKFWKSKEPTKINQGYNECFIQKEKEIMENYKRWTMLFKKKRMEWTR
ncbi:MAG TPA: hypothetical protein VL945_01450 [Candidatus Saccharimonadales bacterium]|nr:hypothetical protein [Candidatus Saccharimonadales bacterium]